MTDYEEELEEMLMENRFIVYKGAYFTCETVYEYKLHIFHMWDCIWIQASLLINQKIQS